MGKVIFMIEKTFQGAWAIHGDLGYRQYMGYTKEAAMRMYHNEWNRKVKPFIGVPARRVLEG